MKGDRLLSLFTKKKPARDFVTEIGSLNKDDFDDRENII